MTDPSAEDPDRSHATEPAAVAEPSEEAAPDEAGAPADPGTGELSEKPVLEWTTEDWARWIEGPASPSRASVEEGIPQAAEEQPPVTAPAVPEAVKTEDDPTARWSLSLEEDDDARWWSSVAGLPDTSAAAPPAPPEEAAPLIPPPPVMPPPPPLTPGAAAPPAPLPPIAEPPVSEPQPQPRRAQPAPAAPLDAAAPSRSPQGGRVSLDPVDDLALRVRAGVSLLGVSVLMGAVAAGLITVAIFMASVVLRRALG